MAFATEIPAEGNGSGNGTVVGDSAVEMKPSMLIG